MASSVNTGSTVSHHLASKVVITVQTFVILYLTYWIAEEYLNNMYLREYVSNVFQANGLMFGVLGTLLVLGSATGLFVRHMHGRSTVSLEIKTPSPTVNVAKKEEKKPDSDFHPVVAALKADMADRRLSFGSMVGSGIEEPTKGSPRLEATKTSVVDQLSQNRQSPTPGQAPMPSPMQGQIVTAFSRPSLPPLKSHEPINVRPEVIGTARAVPVVPVQEPAGSTVSKASQTAPSQVRTTVTTVITGILPTQKKKDSASSPEEKPASQ